MAEFAAAGGHWVLPNIDSTDDSQVRLHVSVAVSSTEDIGEGDVDVALEADGQGLAQLARPGPDAPLFYAELRGMAAIGFFVFDNPNNLSPTRAVVTLRGESVSFDFGPPLVS